MTMPRLTFDITCPEYDEIHCEDHFAYSAKKYLYEYSICRLCVVLIEKNWIVKNTYDLLETVKPYTFKRLSHRRGKRLQLCWWCECPQQIADKYYLLKIC